MVTLLTLVTLVTLVVVILSPPTVPGTGPVGAPPCICVLVVVGAAVNAETTGLGAGVGFPPISSEKSPRRFLNKPAVIFNLSAPGAA